VRSREHRGASRRQTGELSTATLALRNVDPLPFLLTCRVGLIKVTSRGKRAADARNETPPQPPLILVRRETPAAFNGNRTGEAEESRKAGKGPNEYAFTREQ